MKKLNNVLSGSTAKQRCHLYFEDLCQKSISKATGINGFMSDLEQVNLRNTFISQEDKFTYNRYCITYENLTTVLDKIAILYYQCESKCKQYFWTNSLIREQEYLVDFLNILFINPNAANIKREETRLLTGKVKYDSGFFEIERNEAFDLSPVLKSIKFDLIELKTALVTIKDYMTFEEFEADTYKKLINNFEAECSEIAKDVSLDFGEIEVDKVYSKWFKGYFLS